MNGGFIKVVCEKCSGSGTSPNGRRDCPACKGSGTINIKRNKERVKC